MSNIQIAAKAEILGTTIDAAFFKRESEDNLKIDNEDYQFTLSEKIMLVYGKPETPLRKPLTKILQELTFGLVDIKEIKKQVPDAVAKALDGISVSVNQMYFVKTGVDLGNAKSGKKISEKKNDPDVISYKEKKEKSSEYALWINIDIDPKLMEDFPVKVTDLSIKVWSTENAKVLEEMQITAIQKLLEAAGISAHSPLVESPASGETDTE